MSQAASTNPKLSLSYRLRRLCALFRRDVIGLAEDFWKDGIWERPQFIKRNGKKGAANNKSSLTGSLQNGGGGNTAGKTLWHAESGEISEKIWGAGCITPGDAYIDALLIKPLNLIRGTSVLDLAAGLGARMQYMIKQHGVAATGYEPDPDVAHRGQALLQAAGLEKATLRAYDPASFSEKMQYDAIIFRETMYRVAKREKFIAAITACCKAHVKISFTDYIVNPEDKDRPEILAWRAFEKDADPIGLVEMAEMWAKAGIILKVHDDETEHYKKEIKEGLRRFMNFMTTGNVPDEETKKAIEKRIRLWSHRMAAFEHGMRYYRFYGQKQYADPFAGGH